MTNRVDSPTPRPAVVADVPVMVRIINDYAERGLMIHRSMAEFYEALRDFRVIELDGNVVGVAGLRVMWANLAEVYAIALAPEARGKGLGRKLVDSTVDDARRLGVRRLFALTYEREFFERMGFILVDRRDLPLKVWGECIRCPKHEACDEIAMVRVLEDVPDAGAPLPTTGDAGDYHVPIPRVIPAVVRVDRSVGPK